MRKNKKKKNDKPLRKKTTIPGVVVVVTKRQTKREIYKLRGTLRDVEADKVLETGSGTARTEDELLIRADELAARLVAKYLAKTELRKAVTSTGKSVYSDAYAQLTPEERDALCPASWRSSTTRKQGLRYFELTFLTILDAYGGDLTQADANDVLGLMRQKAFENTRRGESESVTEAKVRQHAVDVNRLYPAFRSVVGEDQLPALRLPVPQRQRIIRSEHTKSLPLAVQVTQIALYFRLIGNGLTLGAVLMKLGGLRTAEACGLRYKDIDIYEEYAVIWVLRQLKGTDLSDELKRDDSYRCAIVPRLAVELLRARIEYLLANGFPQEKIADMPVVSSRDDPTQWASSGALSAFVRGVLDLLSITDTDWDAIEETMRAEQDRDENGKPITDACAYLERRNNNTMSVNICGLTSDMVDALSGRKLYGANAQTERVRSDVRNRDQWPLIAAQMERLVLDPAHSAHPLFQPVGITGSSDQTCDIAQVGYTFVAEEDCEVEITVSSVEAGDAVTVESVARLRDKMVLSDPFVPCDLVIGAVYERDWYEELIAKANALEIPDALLPETARQNGSMTLMERG